MPCLIQIPKSWEPWSTTRESQTSLRDKWILKDRRRYRIARIVSSHLEKYQPFPYSHLSFPNVTNMPPLTAIIDQPRAFPPNGDYSNTNWAEWTLSATKWAYGFSASNFLGLARPNLGIRNADNYAIFALCVQYPNLDCVGSFSAVIAKRGKLPFQPAPEAVEKIWQGRSTLPLDSREEPE